MEGEYGSVGGDSVTFAQTLETLKREGSNVLLVGAGATDAHEAVCHRLCGTGGDGTECRSTDVGTGHRYQMVVTGDDDRSCGAIGSDESAEAIERIEYALSESGTEGAEGVEGAEGAESLGSEIIETIDAFDDEADGLDPSELRVCLTSLVTLLYEYDAETVFRLLHMTTAGVGHVNGMGHYHLPLDPEHEAVSLFEPLVDAVVELRTRDGTSEQRWHLADGETTTDWLPL